MKYPEKHVISLSVLLFLLWLGLSGHWTPLLLSLGIASTLLTVYIAHRMDVIDHESHPIHLTWRIPTYWLWLLIEIIKANFDVAKTILGIGEPISPNVVQVKPSQRTDLGQVIYANSITLTPGTISIEMEDDVITVHALTRGSASDLTSGVMDRRVTQSEGST